MPSLARSDLEPTLCLWATSQIVKMRVIICLRRIGSPGLQSNRNMAMWIGGPRLPSLTRFVHMIRGTAVNNEPGIVYRITSPLLAA